MRIFLLLALMSIPTAGLAQQRPAFIPPGETYLWPTNASENVSATFGETRSRHFHAAIDVKTWGKSGFDIYATRDGTLWRISVQPDGYGKFLVLKHTDGSYSAYAHLDDFAPSIQFIADSIRYSRNFGSIDTTFTNRRVQFQKGDLIAYSGATGIGPPHLHFELRSPQNRAFNPLLAGIPMPDRVFPQFSQLGFEALEPTGSVEGRMDFFTKRGSTRGGYHDFGTVKAHGTIGLSSVVFDQANGSGGNTYAVYELETFVDGIRRFHAKADSFSFDQTGEMFLDRVYHLLRNKGLFLQRLWIRDGNSIPFYDRSLGNGTIQDDGKKHTVVIAARDFAGNEKKARVVVDFSRAPAAPRYSVPKPMKGRETGSLIESSVVFGTSNWTRFDWPEGTRFHSFELPLAGVREHRNNEVLIHARTTDFMASHRGRKAFFFRLMPGSPSEIQLPDQSLRMRFSSRSVYDTLLVGVETFEYDGEPAFFIHPENEPTKGNIEIEMLIPGKRDETATYRLYHLSPRWASYRSRNSTMNGPLLSGTLQDFGLHVALPDTVRPVASAPAMFRNLRGQWHLSASARDNLSGIDAQNSWIEWNGMTGITEYDAEKARLIFKHPMLRPGAGKPVIIVVTDRSGNTRRYSFTTR
jgi:hypothetical protein